MARTPTSTAVIGRDAELAVLDDLVASVTSGSGRVLLVEGEAGIGKSHLAEAAAARAEAAGATVVSGSADELEHDRPGRILGGLARGLGAPFDSLAVADGASGGDPAHAVVERFIDTLEDAITSGPVFLVVEDLHWADELSLRGIAGVARRVAPLPLGLLATMRPVPRTPYLHRVLEICRDAGAEVLELAGLDPDDVATMATSLTGAPPGPVLRGRLGAAAGNPLFVTELIRALDDDGALRVGDGIAETEATTLPEELVRTLARRVATLPPDTVEALRLASLLGRDFALADLAVVTGRSVVEVATRLRPAGEAALLTGAGDRLAFSHDLVREATYEHIERAIRTDLHLGAGRALAEVDAPAQQVARHFVLAAPQGDLVAVEWLVRAALDAARIDTGAAAGHLEQALALAPADWEERVEVEATLIELLADSGRVDEARERAEALLDRSLSPGDEVAARRARASVHGRTGQLALAAEDLRIAAALPGVPGVEAGTLRCAAAGMDVIAGTAPPATALAVAREHFDTQDPALACWAHATAAVATVAAGEYDALLEHARRARNLLEATYVPPLGFLIPHAWAATALFELDDLDGAAHATFLARQRAEGRGEVGLQTHTMALAAGLAWVRGRWDDAATETDAALILARETGDRAQKLIHHAIAALVALGRGDRDVAEEHVAAGEAFFVSGPQHPFGLDLLLLARARLLEADDRTDQARAVLALVWEQTANLRGLVQWRSIGPDLVRLTRAAGDVDGARAIAEAIEDLARQSSSVTGHATGRRARALAEADADLLARAVESFREGSNLVLASEAAEESAILLQECGRSREAAVMLEAAASLHEQMGAHGHLARVEARLREVGVRRRRSTATVRASHGWEALSPRELEVIDLVAEGRSNPQIAERLYISRRTVETHLAHVFRKLDLSNRTQLAAARLERREADAMR